MFPDIGGRKVFRDVIWEELRPIFRADHRYYRSHGIYDFPQYAWRNRISRRLFSLLLSVPWFSREVRSEMKKHIVRPYGKVFEKNPLLRSREQSRKI